MTKILTERPDWYNKKFVSLWEGNNGICEYYWLDFGTTPSFDETMRKHLSLSSDVEIPEPLERYYSGGGVTELFNNNIVVHNVIAPLDDCINTQRICRLENDD